MEKDFEKYHDEDITDFAQPSVDRTVALSVDDKLLYVSKESLSMYSPVFRKLFYGNFKESSETVIPLPEKSSEEILEMLKCLFPSPYVKPVDSDNVKMLLPLAEEYQIMDLKRRCEQYLLNLHKTPGVFSIAQQPEDAQAQLDTLILACKYDMNALVEELVPKVSGHMTCKNIREHHDQLSVGVIAALYESKCGQCFCCTHSLAMSEKAKCFSCDRMVEKTVTCKTCRKSFCFGCLVNRKNTKQDACSFTFSSDLLNRRFSSKRHNT